MKKKNYQSPEIYVSFMESFNLLAGTTKGNITDEYATGPAMGNTFNMDMETNMENEMWGSNPYLWED